LSAAYAKNPKDVATVFKLAGKWGDRYDAAKSSEKYREVIALDPDGKQGTTEYMKEMFSYTQMAEFNIGQSALRARPPDPAPLLAFVKKYPEGIIIKESYSLLARMYFGRIAPKPDAAEFFEGYTARYPQDFMAVSSWVRRIIQDKEPLDKGLELAQKAVDLAQGPMKTGAFQSLAQIYLLKGDKAKSAETAETLIKAEEERLKSPQTTGATMAMPMGGPGAGAGTYLMTAARIFVEADKMDRALAVFGPNFLNANMDKQGVLAGYAQFWSGQSSNLDSALIAAKKSTELAPDSYRGWSLLSQIQMKLKKYDEALKSAEKALGIAPAQPPQIRDGIKKTIDQIKAAMEEKK
jgi:tetratricopeptide (TPR) repeat protein